MKVGDVLWGTWVVFFILLFYEMGMDILNSIYNFMLTNYIEKYGNTK
jgi:hypothetical protein